MLHQRELSGSPSGARTRLTGRVVFPLQIQFGLTVVHALSAVLWPCGFSLGWLYFQISYMVSLVIFFLNFYTQVSSFPTLNDRIGMFKR